MPLLTKHKQFFVTADTNGLLSGDNELGSCGRGRYKIWAKAAAAADATLTVNDGSSNVLDAVPIPVDSAAVTYPAFKRSDDLYWVVKYNGAGDTCPIDIADGTNGEVIVTVEFLGA